MPSFRIFIAILLGFVAVSANAADRKPVSFNRDVRPILSENCFKCHGPDKAARQAELRLDNREDAARVLKKNGELLKRITSRDPFVQMPPPDSKLELSKTDIETLQRWIAGGAKYDRHWAFLPVKRPKAHGLRPVGLSSQKRVANAIDRFILARLEQEGLSLSPRASKEALIRRVTFDLTGLPPTLEELDAFLKDDSPQAYEKLVDRLLKSPAFGERMASEWLDVARYSDTYGYQVDRDRFVWPWRDWVIKAFNRNLPYDEFVTWQLAGDLLPNATDEQILATTFNRLHPQKVEGGSVPEEFRVEYVADRAHTFATAFLGLTMECARCHDHKFDPVSQKEYYSLFAYFNNIDEAGLYSYFTPAVPTPTLWLADEATKKRIAAARKKIAVEERNLAKIAERRRKMFERWLQTLAVKRQVLFNGDHAPGKRQRRLTTKPRVSGEAAPPWVGDVATATNPEGVPQTNGALCNPVGVGLAMDIDTQGALPPVATLGFDVQSLRDKKRRTPKMPPPVAHLDFETTNVGGNRRAPGKRGKAVQLTGDDAVGLKVGNFRRSQPFSVSLWMNTPKRFERAVVYHRSRAWTDAGSRGYELLIEDGKLSAALVHFYPGNAIRVRTKQRLPLKSWQHVTVTYDGSSRAAGLRIFVNGKPAELEVVRDKLRKQITGGGGDNIAIGARFRDQGFTNGLVDEFKVFDRELTPIEAAQLHDGKSLTDALKTPAGKLTKSQREELFRFYLSNSDDDYRKQLAALQKSRAQLGKLADGVKELMVMRERKSRRPTFLLERGAYDKPGERVSPGTPAAFPPMKDGWPQNRLGLAKWLTDPRNPLTARVAVNRFWQMLFGEGLVRTPEDFGSQGQPPTHPELLDWLASEFVARGWDVKRLLKFIVMSETYRQSSQIADLGLRNADSNKANPQSAIRNPQSIDPTNKLLSRFPRHRLPAEMLRDNALAVSGLLVKKIGGPPVRPYEVEASFKPVKRNKGEGLYRRSLYTYWKRTAPAPVMMTLDASKRDVCRVKRERTSSPLQALVMLNGPQFAEAARVLAQKLIKRHGDDTDRIIGDLFRVLTSRRPTKAESKILLDLYRAELAAFKESPEKAAALLKTGDARHDPAIPAPRLAAVAVVANTLMNYDGCVMQR